MKKMFYAIVIVVVAALVLAGCMNISNEIVPDGPGEDITVEEYDTAVAEVMDVPVTDASGAAVTDAAGENVTERVFIAPQDVMVTDQDGSAVTDGSGEVATTRIYRDALTGNVVSGGEVHTTQVYVDREGHIYAEKPTQPAVTPTAPLNSEPTSGVPTTLPSAEPSTSQQISAVNEFEYLKSGNFYIKGVMTDSKGVTQPLEMAVTPNSIYMLSDFDGANMGMLISNGTTYMIYEDKQAYLELSSAILNYMGMSTDELLSTNDLNYNQFNMGQADSVLTETLNGVPCTVYVFNTESGSTRFYMNGNKLMRFGSFSASGAMDSVNDVSYISGTVPPEKINPPANYKGYKGVTGLFSFMGLLSDVMNG